MPVVSELIRIEDDGTISFGNYMLAAKSKLQDFEFQGDLYKVKTFGEITKLERNGMFVYESVPGTAVHGFKADENDVTFVVEGPENAKTQSGSGEYNRSQSERLGFWQRHVRRHPRS